MLQKLLGSQVRVEILKKLFTGENRSFYLREFARATGISAPLLSRELRNLAVMGLVSAAEDGNRELALHHFNLTFDSYNQFYTAIEKFKAYLKTIGIDEETVTESF